MMSVLAPARTDVLTFLRRQELAANFTRAELEALAAIAELRACTDGAVVLREGERSRSLYILFRGAVALSKEADGLPDPENVLPDEHTLTRLEAGAILGELSFLDGGPAWATVRASGPCELLVVDPERLARVAHRAPALEAKLTAAVGRAVSHRLRELGEAHVEALHYKLHQVHLRNQFTTFFIVTIALFGIASTVQKLINTGLPPLLQMLYSWGFLLLTFAPISWFVWHLRLPRATWGLTLRNGRRSLGEGLGLGVGITVLAVAWRAFTKAPEEPFVSWGSLATYSPVEFAAFFFAYGPHSFLQEVMGRGVVQGALSRFLPEARPLVPVVLTSALFGIFHLYVSVSFALITFGVSLLFGELYRRHGTLLGVTVLHYVIGMVSVALGFN
jgi:hypothetical protein